MNKDAPANIETPAVLDDQPPLPDEGTIKLLAGEPASKADELAESALSDADREIAAAKSRLTAQRDALKAKLEQGQRDKAAAQERINKARAGLTNVERVLGSFEPRTRTTTPAANKKAAK